MANEFKIKKGLIVTGASGGTVVDIQGSQGQLFSVTDDLSGSIFAVSDISGVPILDINSSGVSTFDGNLDINGSALTITNLSTPMIKLVDTTNNLQARFRVANSYAYLSVDNPEAVGGSRIVFQVDGSEAAHFDSLLNATFAGNIVMANAKILYTDDIRASTGPMAVGPTGEAALTLRTFSTTRLTIASDGDATFTEQAFSSATSSGDASSTLTTKGYVDGLITGATIYRGAWQAGISATSSAATTASTTLTVTAAILDADGNTPVLVGAVVTGAGITGIVKVASVTSSTVYVLDTAITATATAYIFSPIYGAPDLSGVTETSGYYYICSEAGSATPNGANSEPNTWAVGDWCIYNDVSGTGQWQKIDNSSVLSGAGTGQTVALWEGPSSVTDSDTLGNAPITFNGNNATFAGNVIAEGSLITRSVNANVTISGDTSGNIYYNNASGEHRWRADGSSVNSMNLSSTLLTVNENATFTGTITAADLLTVNGDGHLFLGADGETPKIDMMYDDHASGPGWDTRIFTGKTDDLPNAQSFPTSTIAGGYGTQYQANSDGAFFGIIPYTTGHYRPIINWGDDVADTPFSFQFNGSDIVTINYVGGMTAPSFTGDHIGTINTATTGVTQTAGNNSTLIATTAYADAAAAAVDPSGVYLPLTAGSGSSLTDNLYINDVDQNNVGRYGNLQSEVGFTRSPVTGNPNQWFKVVELNGSPKRIKFSIIATGDNTNSYDNFLISTSGYGMNMHIEKLPGGRYNTSKLLSVAAINPSNSGSVEIWIKLGPVSSGTGATYVACTSDVLASATILASATTTAPTLTANDTQLDISGDNRNYATIQTSRGATFGAKVGIGTNAPAAMLTVAGDSTISGNVGIGTTHPNQLLEVANSAGGATISISTDQSPGSQAAKKYLNLDFTGYANNVMARIQSWDESSSTGHGYLTFSTKNASTGLLSQAMIIDRLGNVGIGQDTPLNALDVYRATGDASIRIQAETATASTILKFRNSNADADITVDYTTSNQAKMVFNTDNSGGYVPVLSLEANRDTLMYGKVGIGVTNPRDALEIEGNMRFVDGEDHLMIKPNNAIHGADFIVGDGVDATDTPVMSLNGLYGGQVTIQTQGNTVADKTVLDVQGTQGQLFSVTDDLSGSIFAVADISGVPIFDVNSSGVSYFDGNVGIGTASPASKLHIKTSVDNSVAQGLVIERSTNSDKGYINYNGGGFQFRSTVGDPIVFGETDAEHMRIAPDGNVGIGITNPTSLLHIDPSAAVETEVKIVGGGSSGQRYTGPWLSLTRKGPYDDYGIKYYTESTLNWFVGVPYQGGSGNSYQKFIIGTSATAGTGTVATFDYQGNVGIGVTNPGTKLDIAVTPSAPWMKLINANETAFNLTTYNNGTNNGSSAYAFKHGLYYNSTENAAVTFYRGGSSVGGFLTFTTNNGTERMRIDSNGDVGIGVTNPLVKLHVNQGNTSGTVIKASGIQAQIEIQTSTAGDAHLYMRPNSTGNNAAIFKMTAGTNYNWRWQDDAGTPVVFMQLSQSNSSLSVKGDIIAYGSPSDERYKENIKPIESALDKVTKLQGVTFDWKESDNLLDIKEDIGFIAQDVQKVVPELVRENEDGKLSLRYQGITPILLEAIKELKAEIDLLKSKPCNCNKCNCNI